MLKGLVTVNAILTLPFGIVALAAPAAVFAQFGVHLDAGGQLIARGYGATLVAYGVLLFFARQTSGGSSTQSLLLSMTLFNTIEAVIQGIAGARGVASAVIFGNVAVHAIVALLCAVSLFKSPTRQ